MHWSYQSYQAVLAICTTYSRPLVLAAVISDVSKANPFWASGKSAVLLGTKNILWHFSTSFIKQEVHFQNLNSEKYSSERFEEISIAHESLFFFYPNFPKELKHITSY